MTREIVTSLLGLFVHPLMHARFLTSSLETVYRWHAGLPEKQCVRWPRSVREELLATAHFLLVAETDLRRPISPVVSTTDATPHRGGSTVGVIDPQLAELAFQQTERKGEVCRLDWGPFGDGYVEC